MNDEPKAKITHVAAPNTFAQDLKPACGLYTDPSNPIRVTHVIAEVTCKSCRRTRFFRYCIDQGWKESDEKSYDRRSTY